MTPRRKLPGLMTAAVAAPPARSAKQAQSLPSSLAISFDKKDEELTAACAAFHLADNAAYAQPVSDADLDQVHDVWSEALDTVADLPPNTPEGIRSKALVVLTAFKRRIPVFIGETVEDKAKDYEYAAWRLLHEMLEVAEEE